MTLSQIYHAIIDSVSSRFKSTQNNFRSILNKQYRPNKSHTTDKPELFDDPFSPECQKQLDIMFADIDLEIKTQEKDPKYQKERDAFYKAMTYHDPKTRFTPYHI